MDDQELLALLRLGMTPGVGPRLFNLLLSRFDSATAVFAAPGEALLQVPGLGPKVSAAITAARSSDAAERELERCRRSNVDLLVRGSAAYPSLLEEMPDPPPVLYSRGELQPRDELAIGIVGARRCTSYGRAQAERFAAALARAGLTVVSGLARGIDAAAHRGALSAGGRTIAVCATGLAQLYPPEHADLAKEICGAGAVLTESPLDRGPNRGLFPQRNRIVSGLSLGVLIVEASRKSGALHTARHAMEQGREVFAIPGRIDGPDSTGCHDLIRDGVPLVQSPDDVLEGLGPLREPLALASTEGETDVGAREVHTPRELALNEHEQAVLALVTAEPQHLDQILSQTEIASPRVLSTLTVLEMKRLVRRLPGGYLVRTV